MSVFVTGTDTDVGKTLVSAWLVRHWKAAYWKPVQAGPDADGLAVRNLAPDAEIFPSAYALSQPLSPHLAAERDGVAISVSSFALPRTDRPLVVEGAGGVMVPLNADHTMLDLMERLMLPTIVVARSTLGTINHTLLTLTALRGRAIPILGVVINGPLNPDNSQAIRQFGQVEILAELPPLSPLSSTTLAAFPCPIPRP